MENGVGGFGYIVFGCCLVDRVGVGGLEGLYTW